MWERERQKEHIHVRGGGRGRERERVYARVWGEGRERESVCMCVGGRGREREREPFGPSFYLFSSPWACPMQIWLGQEHCST